VTACVRGAASIVCAAATLSGSNHSYLLRAQLRCLHRRLIASAAASLASARRNGLRPRRGWRRSRRWRLSPKKHLVSARSSAVALAVAANIRLLKSALPPRAIAPAACARQLIASGARSIAGGGALRRRAQLAALRGVRRQTSCATYRHIGEGSWAGISAQHLV